MPATANKEKHRILAIRTLQWTLKGINPETRELSRQAARKSGMKLNAWVDTALKTAAKSELDTSEFRLHIRDNDVSGLLREQVKNLDALENDVRILQRGVIETLLSAKAQEPRK